jgi:hypothetical protein
MDPRFTGLAVRPSALYVDWLAAPSIRLHRIPADERTDDLKSRKGQEKSAGLAMLSDSKESRFDNKVPETVASCLCNRSLRMKVGAAPTQPHPHFSDTRVPNPYRIFFTKAVEKFCTVAAPSMTAAINESIN